MAIEEMFTSLPSVSNATMSDIICAVQGYQSSSNLGISVQESLQQVYNLFQSNLILFNSGNPNGVLAGTTYQFCWDSTNSILYICTVSGTASTAVWTRANINKGLATTVTAAGTTNLTIQSPYWQFFTGTTTQTVVMPDATTLQPGMTWCIVNDSTGNVTVQSFGLNAIVTMAPNTQTLITCISKTVNTAAAWSTDYGFNSGGISSINAVANQTTVSISNNVATVGASQNISSTSVPTFAGVLLPNSVNAFQGLAQPTIQRFTSGSGTYTTPTTPPPLYIRVQMVGGGAGAAGGGSSPGLGGNGGNTTFGTNTAGGASAATNAFGISTPGTPTISLGTGYGVNGGSAGLGTNLVNATAGNGGSSFLGGAGSGGNVIGTNGTNGTVAASNSGSGGGGGGGSSTAGSGSGGSAGAFIDVIITSPAATYAYSVGGGGTAGTAGTNGGAGGSGAAGRITVYEYYQ